ncbi:hypothetical protein BDK92_0485 [Micromonospora pisi]|uniref:Uncharacterized protein n=1 Tax=Micromonospora pisi TaxID=589240 RepID=A0A495JC13_9ACTN|nr:hypothetical protein [Micromonospora pisi]RKR86261.1 hypothetical protein BDK92_0485 [Micromonospora pisi]
MNTVRSYLPLAGMVAATCVAAFLAARGRAALTDTPSRATAQARRLAPWGHRAA